MYTTRLELIFEDTDGKKMTVGLDNPREDLESEEVKKVMDDILKANIFRNKNRELRSIVSARIVTREVEDLHVEQD